MSALRAIKSAKRRLLQVSRATRRFFLQQRHATHLPLGGGLLSAKARTLTITELNCIENFYDLESDSSQQWRWSGPGTSFSIFAPIERDGDCKVMLEVLHSTSPINWHNTFLECEDQLQLCSYHTANGRHYLQARLPARPGHGSALLRYHIQETRRPTETDDGRYLGLRVLAVHALLG